MIFHLALYHQKTAVITEKGRNYSYADLSEVSTRIVAKIERNSLVFCLCLNHWASLAGYVGFLNAQHPIVLLDGKKDKDIIQDLIRIYSPRYLWLPTNRSNEFEGHTIAVEEDYSLVELGSRPYPLHPDLSLLLKSQVGTAHEKKYSNQCQSHSRLFRYRRVRESDYISANVLFFWYVGHQ